MIRVISYPNMPINPKIRATIHLSPDKLLQILNKRALVIRISIVNRGQRKKLKAESSRGRNRGL